LILEHHYLPYAAAVDLQRIPESSLCTDVECVKKRAIEVLTSDDEEPEVYRQLVYMLSVHTTITGLNPYIIAIIRARALKSPFGSTIYDTIRELMHDKRKWKDVGYKRAVATYADLVQLNFAYTPMEHIIGEILTPYKKPTEKKALVATLQSKALIGRLPLRPFKPSTVDASTAEEVVDFCVRLRQRVVEGFLELRPLRAGDIFQYVYTWAKRESERLSRHYHLVRRLDEHIYEELFVAPYYLHHYGVLSIDFIRYELFWEIG